MYQGFSGFFLTIIFLFTLLKNEHNIKQIIKDLILGSVALTSRNIAQLVFCACGW